MAKTSSRKRKAGISRSSSSASSSSSAKKKTPPHQSILSKLAFLREMLQGSAFSETDLSNCLRQCGYNVELAAERLITGQFTPSSASTTSGAADGNGNGNGSSDRKGSDFFNATTRRSNQNHGHASKSELRPTNGSISTAKKQRLSVKTNIPPISKKTSSARYVEKRKSPINSNKVTPPAGLNPLSIKKTKIMFNGNGQKVVENEAETEITDNSGNTLTIQNPNGLLLCQRWIVGFSTRRNSSIRYHESVTLSTSMDVKSGGKKGANIVRFKGSHVEGTLDPNLSSMLSPLMRFHDDDRSATRTLSRRNNHENSKTTSSAISIGTTTKIKAPSEKSVITVVAKGLMEDRDLRIGSEIPLELAIYIQNPFKFFALLHEDKHANSYFVKKNSSISRGSVLNRAAFNILQWAHYGNAPLFECDDNTVVAAKNLSDEESCSISEEGAGEDCDNVDTIVAKEEEIDENAPAWAGDLMNDTNNQLPEESEPVMLKEKGISLKCYQRQALYWMMRRELGANDKESSNLQKQLQLLSELSDSNHASRKNAHTRTDSMKVGVMCSVGPVIVSDEVAAKSKSLDGANDSIIHPLWQRRFLWDNCEGGGGKSVYSFFVNELLQTSSISAPNPPKECIGGMLCDSMGLGKTVMLLALIAKDKEMGYRSELHNPTIQDESDLNILSSKLDLADPASSNNEQSLPNDEILSDGITTDTKQILSVSGNLSKVGMRTTLVVAPLSLLSQWEEEITSKSSLKCLAYYGDKGRKLSKSQILGTDVLLTTYGTLQSEFSLINKERPPKNYPQLLSIEFHRVILDEAHIIKNQKTSVSAAACSVKATKRWCVTGTPISNSLQDVYGLLKFLKHEPWCEGSFWKKAIKSVKPGDGDGEGDDVISTSLDRVRRVLEPLILRRTKDTLRSDGQPILTLPPVDSKTVSVELTSDERLFYSALLTKSQDVFDGFIKAGTASKSWFAIFSLLQRLRQACDHLALTVKSRLDEGLIENCPDAGEVTAIEALKVIDDEEHPADSIQDQFLKELLESTSQSKSGDGYSQKVVESLTNCIQENSALQDECAICLEIPQSSDIAVTPCHHIFCRSCLVKTMNRKTFPTQSDYGQCPICAKEISEDSLICTQVEESSNDEVTDLKKAPSKDLDFKEILDAAVKGNCSSKMLFVFSELKNIWESDPGSKVLIFSQYLGMLDLLQFQMKRKNMTSFRLDGKLSRNARRQVLSSFNEWEMPSNGHAVENEEKHGCVLLASMKACGVGMNLTSASSVFILDPWWSFALESQCISRIHRIGQTAEVVRVRKFIVSDSVEEKIVKMQERKKGMASEVLSDKYSGIGESSNPSLDDLRAIFGR